MSISSTDRQHVVVTVQTEQIDILTADEFGSEVDVGVDAALAVGATRLTLDFGAVTFIDSMGVGKLIDARTRAEKAGCRLDLVNPSRAVRVALEVLGLDTMFGVA
jgi:anti-sigma B factor antagonist